MGCRSHEDCRRMKGGSMIGVNRRRVMGGGGSAPLPYDAEIEFLETSANNKGIIDTGVVPDETTVLKIKFINTTVTSAIILGSYDSETKDWRLFNTTNQRIYFDTYNGERLQGVNGTLAVNTLYEFELGNYYVKDIPTDSILLQGTQYTGTGYGHINLWGDTSTRLSYNRIYYCQIYQSGQLVRDLIPVRIGQVGHLFDRVNGVLYSNRMSQDFILGPDITT